MITIDLILLLLNAFQYLQCNSERNMIYDLQGKEIGDEPNHPSDVLHD